MGNELELAQRLTKKRWIILVVSCLINLCIGSMYAWSVFSGPMAEYINGIKGTTLTAGSLAIVFSIANGLSPVALISGGTVNDRFGPKWLVFFGGLVFGGGLVASGFAKSVTGLIFTYGVFGALGMGFVYGCTVSNCVKFFPDRRGLIGGITTAFYGLSSVIIPPVAKALIDSVGITSTFKIIGIVFIVVICAGAFFMEQCPVNFAPVGWTPPVSKAKNEIAEDKNWKGMLKSPIFYVMILMLLCGANFGMMMISQASSIAQDVTGMTLASATIVVSVLALFNGAGRVIAGYISDKIGRINTLTVMLVLAVAALLLLYFCPVGGFVQFYIGIALVGVCFGSFMGVYPGFTADRFGAKNNSVNYGIMFIGFALAGLIGPSIMTSVYNSSGSYAPAFLIAIGLAVVGLALSCVYRVMLKKQK